MKLTSDRRKLVFSLGVLLLVATCVLALAWQARWLSREAGQWLAPLLVCGLIACVAPWFKRWQAVVVILLLLGYVPLLQPRIKQWELRAFGAPGWHERSQALEGQLAPDFELVDLDGQTFRLSEHRGKVVFIERWRSWCPPCLENLPYLSYAHAELAGEGLVVSAMNAEPPHVQEVLRKDLALPFPMLVEDTSLPRLYTEHEVFPQTLLIDREGRFARVDVGGGYYLLRELMREIRGEEWDGVTNVSPPLTPGTNR
ncbi:MAG: TlpA disulfide reductase family protein [Acidobacteriota bacterium]